MMLRPLLVLAVAMATAACADGGGRSSLNFAQTPQSAPAAPQVSSGEQAGAQLAMAPGRAVVPAGFRAIPMAAGIPDPTGLAVDDVGGVYVIQGGNQLVRLGAGGGRDLIASGTTSARWTGVTSSSGQLFVTAFDSALGGQLLRIGAGGRTTVLLQGVPVGDNSVGAPVVGPDGLVYFAIGSITDAGVVEKGAPWRTGAAVGNHDIPCQDVQLTGSNFTQDHSVTGAFLPYGTPSRPGQVIAGQVPCTGAVLRASQDGGAPQLVAWGFRDPRSLSFTPDGRLYLLDGNFQGNGIRPVSRAGDLVFAVAAGVWYGWPDAHGAQSTPPPLLASDPNPPPRALAEFAPWISAASLAVARADLFGGPAQAYVGLEVPKYGFRVVRLDLRDGQVSDFAEFPEGSAPVALSFTTDGQALYVLEKAGTLWRVQRDLPVG